MAPESIPDYLGLVGDTADGFPGIKGWGAKSSATLLSHYHHIENIPNDHMEWAMQVRSSQKLSDTLNNDYELALLFKLIATIDYDAPTFQTVNELKWNGPKDNYENILKSIDGDRILQRLDKMETN